jgi:ATP-dependent helicase/nuclease subunit B
VQIRFLLGPAGSGKTFRCLAEIRDALRDSPEGPPLLLLAPKQATFQLERQLLAGPALSGYTRLQILSFDRLAGFILGEFAGSPRQVLEEEGWVMALRALLGRNQSRLKIFHSTTRLPGFAQQLNLLLREFQRQQLSPRRLASLADQVQGHPALAGKLHDSALLIAARRVPGLAAGARVAGREPPARPRRRGAAKEHFLRP